MVVLICLSISQIDRKLAGFCAIQAWRHLQERRHDVPELLAIRAQGNGMRGARQNDELPVLEWELLVEVEQGLV
jgi:hypothetical protein